MELTAELAELFTDIQTRIRSAVEKTGGTPSFALVRRLDGAIDRLDAEPSIGDESQALSSLFAKVIPLARDGSINASALCVSMSETSSDGMKAVAVDLEHRDGIRRVAMVVFSKKLLRGWTFHVGDLKEQSPRLFAKSEGSGVNVEHPEFLFTLGGDWRQLPNDDPEPFGFESSSRQTSVVISAMPARLPKEKLLEAANVLADARQRAEVAGRPGAQVVFGDRFVELKENGDVGYVAYAGYDTEGNIFRFMGWTTQAKVLSFWVSTRTTDNELSKRVFDEAFGGLRFYIP